MIPAEEIKTPGRYAEDDFYQTLGDGQVEATKARKSGRKAAQSPQRSTPAFVPYGQQVELPTLTEAARKKQEKKLEKQQAEKELQKLMDKTPVGNQPL